AHAGPSFNFLAEDLTDQLLDGDPKADESEATRDQLTALIAARRKQAPRDPWTWFFEASGHDAANRFDDAEKGFAAAAKALEDWDGEVSDADRDRFRSSRVYSLYRAKKGLTALEDVGPPDKTFRQLAWLYTGDKDADGLAALAAAHAAEAPDDRAVVYFRAEVHYIKAEYAAAARLYADYRRGAAENDDPRPMTAAEREVRARVRSGDAAGARRVASGLPPDWTGATLRAVSLAAAGDVAGLERLLEEQAKTPGGVGGLYYDEDFVRLFAAPAFADLRQRFPDPRPRPAGQPG
ncbi:MAG TPA: hypothetical protein VH092_33395, partial [Urbifossiella sp.]|nr:hypothetical protein [Urbifossiella sp.]